MDPKLEPKLDPKLDAKLDINPCNVGRLFGSKVGYCIDAVVLGQSLHFHGTRYPYILLITDDVPESWQTVLTKVGWELRRTTYLDGDHLYVAGSKGRFSGVFTKLHLSFA